MYNNNVPKTAVDDEQDGDEEGGHPRRIYNGIRPVTEKTKEKTISRAFFNESTKAQEERV